MTRIPSQAPLSGNSPGPSAVRHAHRRCAGRTTGDQEDGRGADHVLSADLPPQLVLSPGQARHVGLQPERHSRLRPILPRGGGRGDAHLSRLSPAQPVTESTVSLQTADGLRLEVRRWREDSVPHQWTFVVVHGLGEHSGRYQHLAAWFTPLGATVYAMDQRGHGRSGGKRGHAPGLNALLDDIDMVVVRARAEDGGPVVLIGHSFGGLLSIAYARITADHLDPEVCSAPLLRVKQKVPAWKRALSAILPRVAPGMSFSNEVAANLPSPPTGT